MRVSTLEKKQIEMEERINKHAEELGLTKYKLKPITDGVSDISGYLASDSKIMWILKEPWGNITPTGIVRSFDDWSSFPDLFQNDDIWHDERMWQVMIQVTYAIHNKKKWTELKYIENNQEMIDELKKIAYINLSKMPGKKDSPANHLKECYPKWKDITLDQIKLYNPDIIIFGNTFDFFKEDLKITTTPKRTTSRRWYTNLYKENNRIYIDAYHPSRKGGEDGSHDYVTSIVNAVRKIM